MSAKKSKALVSRSSSRPRSLVYAERGIHTGMDFANLMSSLMSDLIRGDVTPQVGNSVCNAGDKLLKIVSMQHRYGTTREGDETKILTLSNDRETRRPTNIKVAKIA